MADSWRTRDRAYWTPAEWVDAEGVWNVARGAYEVRKDDGRQVFYEWGRPMVLGLVIVKSVFILIGLVVGAAIGAQFIGWSGPHPSTRDDQLQAAVEDRYNASVWPVPQMWDGSQDFTVDVVQDYSRPGEYWQDPLSLHDCVLHPGIREDYLRLRCPDRISGELVELDAGGAAPEDGPAYELDRLRGGRPVRIEELYDVPLDDPLWDLYMAQEANGEN